MTFLPLRGIVPGVVAPLLFPVFALPATWQQAGPFGGSAQVVVVDPNHANVLLAGTQNTMVFLSEDGAQSWRPLPFPRNYSGTVRTLAIFPSEPRRYWAGVSSEDRSKAGIWESLDGGEHWRALPGLAGRAIESLAIWEGDATVCAVGTQHGVFLTNDQGRTWRQISPAGNFELQDITAIAFDPIHASTVYAGTPHLPWKTTDGGATWRSIRNGMVDDSDVFSIHLDARRPERVFASACSGIYRSDDAGKSWRRFQTLPGTNPRTHVIMQDPQDANLVYAGTTTGLFQSQDAGDTWRQLNALQVNSLAFDPTNSQTLYLATEYGGLLKSANGGATQEQANRGFSTHKIAHLAASGDALYANSIYQGDFGGVFVSTSQGREWHWRAGPEAFLGGNLYALAGTKSGRLYGATGRGVIQSNDNGATWAPLRLQPRTRQRQGVAAQTPVVRALVAIEQDGKTVLFAGTAAGLFRRATEESHWEWIEIAGQWDLNVRAIYTSPGSPGEMAVLTTEGLFTSMNGGTTWRSSTLPRKDYAIYDVALSCAGDEAILLATSHGLYRSQDAGTSWTRRALPPETVTAVECHPTRLGELFAAQYGRIYRSVDGGSEWTPLAGGLNGALIDFLWIAPWLPDRAFASAREQGILYFDLK